MYKPPDAYSLTVLIDTYFWFPFTTGKSTNFGLKEAVEEKWKRLQELESHGDFTSTYSQSFKSVISLEPNTLKLHILMKLTTHASELPYSTPVN